MESRRSRALIAALVVMASAACGSGFEPSLQTVAGSYAATEFQTDEAGTVTDWTAAGALLSLVLQPDGSTTGQLLVPNGNEDGSDFDADLVGTWLVVGDTVRLDHAADTFLRDIDFLATRDQLRTDDTIGSLQFHILLTRQ